MIHYKLYRFKPGSGQAIEQFMRLENDIFRGHVNANNIDCQSLINAIIDYVDDIETSGKNAPISPSRRKLITTELRNAPSLSRVRVYDYMPGTGQATTQFYKFIRAISHGTIDCKKLSTESLLLIIKNYIFDQIE